MESNRKFGRYGFWLLAFLWLPAGIAGQAVVRFTPANLFSQHPGGFLAMVPFLVLSLLPAALCGLPLALGCRRIWRLGHRRSAWAAGIALGLVSVFAALMAGLLGPVAIAVVSVVLSLPVWIAGWLLARRHRRQRD